MISRILLIIGFAIISQFDVIKCGILQPRPSIAREQQSLDGLWKFSINNTIEDEQVNSDDLDLRMMPVPSSYNDIFTSATLRDHVGLVYYSRTFFTPKSWSDLNVWIRFGSVCYSAVVEINGEVVVTHEIGHLPFAAEISSVLKFDDENTITVAVDNSLNNFTIPQGTIDTLKSGRVKQTVTFDFFNYAGIDRSVVLYTTAKTYIDDIFVNSTVNGTTGIVKYAVVLQGASNTTTQKIAVLDKNKKEIATSDTISGNLYIANANLWWPYLMNPNPGYMYTLRVDIFNGDTLLDRYDQPFGIRELTWNNDTFKINGRNIYIRGVGRHEDSDIRGKGLDLPLIIRDHNLLRWLGVNAYRTSHYPYAEEIMDITDQLGIMIIDEVPAVSLDNFTSELLETHKQSITELIRRDKNRPSVVLWSAANEPRTAELFSDIYFRSIIDHLKNLDASRPVTIPEVTQYNTDQAAQMVDIISINRYYGWYTHSGDVDEIIPIFVGDAHNWRKTFNKPILVSEYGADTLEGLHDLPAFIWSEEYQNNFLSLYFQAFDTLRAEGWFIGEMIWNFADFKTSQTYTRVGGNKKGLFTRNRQPKSSAYLVRNRYWALAKSLENATVPSDLNVYYFAEDKSAISRDEL